MTQLRLRACILFALSSAVLPGQAAGQSAPPPTPVTAEFATPTDRYPHNIMGRRKAHTDLIVDLAPCRDCGAQGETLAIRLPVSLVFEDFAPRLVDLNRDGRNEILVVESDQGKGARLALWEVTGDARAPRLVRGATTEFIGTRFRWLAPIGAADFDGDGAIELAYVETPHRDRILRIVRREGATLRQIMAVAGVTNHAIGQEMVQSRVENCADGPTIFALNASGDRVLSVQIRDGAGVVMDRGPAERRDHLDDGPLCDR